MIVEYLKTDHWWEISQWSIEINIWVDPALYVTADSMYNWMQNMYHTAKLSTSQGCKCRCFVLILEYNPPYVQSDFTSNPGPTNIFGFTISCQIRKGQKFFNYGSFDSGKGSEMY